MTRLEDLLRDSLAERADDVSSTPALWSRVQERTTARRRRSWTLAAAGTAAVVAVGTFVVPDLLEGPDRRPILIDPSPSASEDAPDDQPTPGGDQGAVADPTATHAVAVVDGMLHWYDLDDPDGRHLLAIGTEAPVQDIAVRPRLDGQQWQVAYTSASPDGGVELRLVTLPGDALDRGVAAVPDDIRLSEQSSDAAGNMPTPGLAWSPDGNHLAWLVHGAGEDGEPLTSVEVIGWQDAVGEVNGQYATGVPLFASDEFDRVGLTAWTWDATFEDGRVGRLLLAGDGEDMGIELLLDATGIASVGAYGPLDLGEAAAAAGAATGPLLVRPGTGDATFVVEGIGAADPEFVWTDQTRVGLAPDFLDLAAAGDQLVVSTGYALVFQSPENSFVRETDASVAAVDLAHTPWDAAFVPPSGPSDPNPQPTQEPVPSPPDLAVREFDGGLQVIANVLGEGGPEVVLDLGGAPSSLGDAPVHGVSVRPGSTLDDLEAVAVVAVDDAYEFWWVRSTGQNRVAWDPFPAQHQPVAPVGDDLKPIPVFSPNWYDPGSRYLAWVDHAEGGDQTLRFVGWVDGEGPGTGDPASDNTSFAIQDRTLLQLDAWRWADYETDEGNVPATLTFTSWDEQGQMSALTNEFLRQPDGAISMDDECFCGEPGHGSHTHESVFHAPTGWGWSMDADADGNRLVGWSPDPSADLVRPTMPPALRDHPGPVSMELVAWGDTVAVTVPSDGTTWILSASGSVDTFDAGAFDWLD